MKQLSKEFTSNVDKSGDNIFREIQREGMVAIYQRFSMDELSRGYEVFTIKVVKAGTPLPNGTQVEEDYERYPSKNDFGKRAWSTVSLESALSRFKALVQNAVVVEDVEEDDGDETVAVVRIENPTPSAPNTLKFPSGKFTHGELAEFNGKTRQQVYGILQTFVKTGVLKKAGERVSASGKGKASILFEKA